MAWSASESFTLASCIAKSASGIVSRAVDVAFGSPSRVFTGDSGGWFLPVGEIMSARASSTNVETTPSVTASSIASSFVINSIACLGERAVSEVDGDAGRGGEDCACWNSSSSLSIVFVLAWFAPSVGEPGEAPPAMSAETPPAVNLSLPVIGRFGERRRASSTRARRMNSSGPGRLDPLESEPESSSKSSNIVAPLSSRADLFNSDNPILSPRGFPSSFPRVSMTRTGVFLYRMSIVPQRRISFLS